MQAKMKALAAAAALMAGLGFGSGASANIVDLLDDPAGNGVHVAQASGLGSTAFMEWPGGAVPSTTILGGYRDLVSSVVGSNGVGTPVATSEVGGGGYSFSTTSGDRGIGKIQWDGQDNSANLDPTGLGGLNLVFQAGCPTSGCTKFVATVLETDLGFTYSIGIYTDAANYSILTSVVPLGFTGGQNAIFDFVDWTLASGNYVDIGSGIPFNIQRFGSGPDFTNVGAIEFIVNSDGGTVAVDLALGSITKVPEPGTLALLGIGLLGASLGARRRKVAAK